MNEMLLRMELEKLPVVGDTILGEFRTSLRTKRLFEDKLF